jgi:hypothetical protein
MSILIKAPSHLSTYTIPFFLYMHQAAETTSSLYGFIFFLLGFAGSSWQVSSRERDTLAPWI